MVENGRNGIRENLSSSKQQMMKGKCEKIKSWRIRQWRETKRETKLTVKCTEKGAKVSYIHKDRNSAKNGDKLNYIKENLRETERKTKLTFLKGKWCMRVTERKRKWTT